MWQRFDGVALPRWTRVRQQLYDAALPDVRAAVHDQFARPEIRAAIRPGTRVVLTGGSRGIDRIAEVLAAAVAEVRQLGGEPFAIPAMGSHGGATAEGQLAVLAEYGITEETLDCPIRASMETIQLGEIDDFPLASGSARIPVWFDAIAAREADLIIPVGRVKPHTDFHGPVESGLMKMIAIGLGKQKGADTLHSYGFAEFHQLIPAVARFTLARQPIPFGIALIEDGHGRLAQIEAVPAAQIELRERELVQIAREWMPRLPGESIDVLVVDAIGKDISGIGADTNVLNRYYNGPLDFPPHIQRLIVRDLTPATEGNATGIGLFDITLRQVVDKIDPVSTYMNVITAKTPAGARVPLTVENDRLALQVALATCLQVVPEHARIARISDTKHLEEFWASEALLADLRDVAGIEALSDLAPIAFDQHGMFSA